MDAAHHLVLLAGALGLLSIFAGLFSARFGTPLPLVFLAIGILFGKEGPVGLVFNDFRTAYLIGSVALAVILFEGGLKTKRSMLKIALWPAVALATAGVAITAGIVCTMFALLSPPPSPYSAWVVALLIGAILAPTDAAAVAVLLRRARLALPKREGDGRWRVHHGGGCGANRAFPGCLPLERAHGAVSRGGSRLVHAVEGGAPAPTVSVAFGEPWSEMGQQDRQWTLVQNLCTPKTAKFRRTSTAASAKCRFRPKQSARPRERAMAVLSPPATFLCLRLVAKAIRADVRFCGRTANASSAEGGVSARTAAGARSWSFCLSLLTRRPPASIALPTSMH